MADDLHPIDPSLLPFKVGEKVAFREDHPEHGRVDDEDGTQPAKYGVVQTVGVNADGHPAFDLLLIDPRVGVSGDEDTVYRATLGDIQ